MPTNFRLSYNTGSEYIDMFFKSKTDALVDIENVYQIVTVDVTIPATTSNVQDVTLATDDKMANSAVRMILKSTGKQAEYDYSTITQFQVNTGKLTITRLYTMPKEAIEVTLIFFEKKGES